MFRRRRHKRKYGNGKRIFNQKELDVFEMGLYGDIRDEQSQIKCRCKSFMEFENAASKGNGQRPPKDSDKYPNCP